jgi:hypothetical protein
LTVVAEYKLEQMRQNEGDSSDVPMQMIKKLARRKIKLADAMNESTFAIELSKRVDTVCLEIRTILDARFKQVVQAERRTVSLDFSAIDFKRDSEIEMQDVKEEIHRMMVTCSSSSLNQMELKPTVDPLFTFHATWSQIPIGDLFQKVIEYVKLARKKFQNNPEGWCSMILTLLKVWEKLDRKAIDLYPLVKEHKTGIDCSVFESLLVPYGADLKRLHDLQQYITERDEQAKHDCIYSCDIGAQYSFGVRYFDRTKTMQETLQSIVQDAYQKQEKKKQEIQKQIAKYNEGVRETNRMSHTCHSTYYRSCKRCTKQSELSQMEIDVYEWPLPRDTNVQKAAVFELRIPKLLAGLRDLTYLIVGDLLHGNNVNKARKLHTTISKYDQLKYWYGGAQKLVTLGSSTKPFTVAHYKSHKIEGSNGESTWLKPNGLTYELCVNDHSVVPHHTLIHTEQCKMKIEDSTYKCLQWTIDSDSYTENEVLAKQGECSKELTIPEYENFGTLRANNYIQWRNLLAVLESHSITIKSQAAYALLCQLAWQARSWNKMWYRGARFDLKCRLWNSVLEQLNHTIDRFAENWNERNALATVVTLSAHVLAVLEKQEEKSKAAELIRKCRNLCLSWITKMKQDCLRIVNVQNLNDMRKTMALTAACGALTYAVDTEDLSHVLNNASDVFDWLKLRALIHDELLLSQVIVTSLPLHDQNLLWRVDWAAHRMQHAVIKIIEQNTQILDQFTVYSWPIADIDESSWSYSETIFYATLSQNHVSVDIISGKFLVNNAPVARLDTKIINHELYKRAYDASITFDVIPSGQEGAVTKHEYHGATLSFKLINDSLVISEMYKDTNKKLVLLPHTWFKKHLPTILVEEYEHWYDESTEEIEFRKARQSVFTVPEVAYRYYINQLTLVDEKTRDQLICIRSVAFNTVVQGVLDRLESSSYTHMFRDSDGNVFVDLPRMNLRFFVNQRANTLQLREFGNMNVHKNQTIGTLVGLQQGLVIHNEYRRVILIPNATISRCQAGSHHTVVVDTLTVDIKSPYLEYEINDDLQELQSTSSINSLLMLAYLHASTSHYLADPFTGVTGYEMALRILQSARCNITQPLLPTTINILNLMNTLSPIREYYPPHAKLMQRVRFPKNLHSLAACDAYYLITNTIIANSSKFSCLYKDAETVAVKQNPEKLELAAKSYWRDEWQYGADGRLKQQFENIFPSPNNKHYNMSCAVAKGTKEMSRIVFDKKFSSEANLSIFEFLKRNDGVLKTCEISNNIGSRLSVDIRKNWLSLLQYAANISPMEQIYLFSLLQFVNQDHVKDMFTLASLLNIQGDLNIPQMNYELQVGHEYNSAKVISILEDSLGNEFPNSRWDETERKQKDTKVKSLSVMIQKKWNEKPGPIIHPYLDKVNVYLKMWKKNRDFKSWVENKAIQIRLNVLMSVGTETDNQLYVYKQLTHPKPRFVVLTHAIDCNTMKKVAQDIVQEPMFTNLSEKIVELVFPQNCIDNHKRCAISQDLANDLQQSWKAQTTTVDWQRIEPKPDIIDRITRNLRVVIKRIAEAQQQLQQAWNGPTTSLHYADLVPKFSKRILLACLNKNSTAPQEFKKLVVQLGVMITMKQRLERCLQFAKTNAVTHLKKELCNEGHTSWKPEEKPEWLLLEIENKFLVRPVQAQVAQKMIDAEESFVLQLNMGEGKTSVIVPLLVASLVDTKQMIRVVVMRSLLSMMKDSLQVKMGGILERSVHVLPFQRDFQPSIFASDLQNIKNLYETCVQQGGVVITTPEYMLSFQLMCLERTMHSEQVAKQYISIQRWLDENCRDILDESDEILSVKNQLVYTVGVQEKLDGGALRWTVIQRVLEIMSKHAKTFAELYPKDFEYNDTETSGAFPHFRCISLAEEPYKRLCETIMQEALSLLPEVTSEDAKILTAFATNEEIKQVDIRKSKRAIDENAYVVLLILRGLLGCKVLYFSLTKRWRVNYGVAVNGPRRLAVPFRAKDIASERTEFGHPDVAIILTQLSYYYSGLSEAQIEQAFAILSETPMKNEEYAKWLSVLRKEEISTSISTLDGINLKDTIQKAEITKLMTKNMKVIDFWLSHVVYYSESKQFQYKLSSSGWDVAKTKKFPTVGFSGTNDTRLLLPLSIKQNDIKKLKGTNALVVRYLLQPENNNYVKLPNNITSLQLLETIKETILLDVGALMIELNNEQVAQEWLNITTRKPNNQIVAAIYFNDNNDLIVRDLKNRVELLSISPYRQQLQNCLIYLDDAHCRGTDLKLPPNAKAALTLGKGVTKDKFVQGCMRMRLLGHGQALCFYASHEVNLQIETKKKVQVADVIKWTFENSRKMIQDGFLLYSTQGVNHYKLDHAWKNVKDSTVKQLGEKCKQTDAMLLNDLYGNIRSKQTVAEIIQKKCEKIPNANAIVQHCNKFVGNVHRYAQLMEEEQERELETEKEDERQVHRPSPATPCTPVLNQAVIDMIETNNFNSDEFIPLNQSMVQTTLAQEFSEIKFDSNIYCTRDFISVVEKIESDEYLRSVRYIAVHTSNNTTSYVLLSHHEVNCLLGSFYTGQGATLHMYAPRVRPQQSILFDNPSFCVPQRVTSVPESIMAELFVYSSSLYFNSNQEREWICDLLGFCLKPRTSLQQEAFDKGHIHKSGFVPQSVRSDVQFGTICKFEKDPAILMQKYLHKRSRNDSIIVSHLGLIVTKGEKKDVE